MGSKSSIRAKTANDALAAAQPPAPEVAPAAEAQPAAGLPQGQTVNATAQRNQDPGGEANPGMDDVISKGDVDLSTSDTTVRRRAGFRQDPGIRI